MDLRAEEYVEGKDDWKDDAERLERVKGKMGWAWRTWYFVA